jgi:hypothetical protein
MFFKFPEEGWGCSSVVECLLGMCKALDSILSTMKEKIKFPKEKKSIFLPK